MSVSVACPRCSQLVDAAAANGQKITCNNCGDTFPTSPSKGTYPPKSAKSKTGPVSDTNGTGAENAKLFGRFHILAELGRGAFGTVYRAKDIKLGREVALKVPHPHLMQNPELVKRFLAEAKAAAYLRHPSIVPVFEAGKTDQNEYFYISQFVPGRALSEVVSEGPLEFRRAARIMRQLAEAVAYAHDQGIVHRDLKPGNILLESNERPQLVDFGLAVRSKATERLTKDGQMLGTPHYMAPELVRGEATAAADQYALGVTLYELLTGTTPFEGMAAVIFLNALRYEPEAPSKRRAKLPKDLEVICLKAMAKRPEDRYADCQEFANDLRRWLDGQTPKARSLGAMGRLRKWVSRNRVVAGFSTVIAVLLIAGIVVSSWFGLAASKQAANAEHARRVADGERIKVQGEQQRAATAMAQAQIDQKRAEFEWNRAETNRKIAEAETGKAKIATQEAIAAKILADAEAKKALETLREKEAALKLVVEAQNQSTRDRESARKADEFAKQAEKERLLAETKGAAYSLGRPQLYSHLLRQIEAKNRNGISEALKSVPQTKRGWEWEYLDGVGQTTQTPSFRKFNLSGGLPRDYRFDKELTLLVGFDNDKKKISAVKLDHAPGSLISIPYRQPLVKNSTGKLTDRDAFGRLYPIPMILQIGVRDKETVVAIQSNSTVLQLSLGKPIEQNTPHSVGFDVQERHWCLNSNCSLIVAVGKGPGLGASKSKLLGKDMIEGFSEVSQGNPIAKEHVDDGEHVPPAFSDNGEFYFKQSMVVKLHKYDEVNRYAFLWRKIEQPPVEIVPAKQYRGVAQFSPSNRSIAIAFSGYGAELRSLRVYPIDFEAVKSKTIPIEFLGHTADIRSIAFFPDDTRLVTGSTDGTVKIWDAATQECLLTLPGPGGDVVSVSVSSDGKRVGAIGESQARIWEVKPEKKESAK